MARVAVRWQPVGHQDEQALLHFLTASHYERILECWKPEEKLAVLQPAADGLSPVHVVYATDTDNFGTLLTSMISVVQHADHSDQYLLHILLPVGNHSRQILSCWGEERARLPAGPALSLHHLRSLPFDVSLFRDCNARLGRADYANEPSFARFYLPEYLPAARRAVWLDTDTIVKSDLRPLYMMHMKHSLAAVPEKDRTWQSLLDRMAAVKVVDVAGIGRAVRNTSAQPFNTGVLLYELEKWRADPGIQRRLELAAVQLSGFFSELGAMNLVLQEHFDPLDVRWNLQFLGNGVVPRLCVSEAHVLHWTGTHAKPGKPARPRLQDDYLFEPYSPRSNCNSHP